MKFLQTLTNLLKWIAIVLAIILAIIALILFFTNHDAFEELKGFISSVPEWEFANVNFDLSLSLKDLGFNDSVDAKPTINISLGFVILCVALLIISAIFDRVGYLSATALAIIPFCGYLQGLSQLFYTAIENGSTKWQAANSIFGASLLILVIGCSGFGVICAKKMIDDEGDKFMHIFKSLLATVGFLTLFIVIYLFFAWLAIGLFKWVWTIWALYIMTLFLVAMYSLMMDY